MTKPELSREELEQRRKAPMKHGGAAARDAIRNGEEFKPATLAHNAEMAVRDELETSGRFSLVLRNAARMQAACDLYWNAVETAAQNNDLEALDRYIKRFGWLAGAALRAWAQVKQEQSDSGGNLIIDAIAAARKVGDDEHSDTD